MKDAKQAKRPRGDSLFGSQRRWEQQSEDQAELNLTKPVDTLQRLLKCDPNIISRCSKYLDEYVERNIRPEVNKAIALRIFNTAVDVWGDGIMSASQKAADVVGVNRETERRWAADYYLVLVDFDP